MQFALFYCVLAVYGQLAYTVEVDSRCEDLVDGVPEACRNLLVLNVQEDAFLILDRLCSGYCGSHIHQFFRQCDARTGQYNSTVLDFYCTKNHAGGRCGDAVLSVFAGDRNNPLEACYGDDGAICPEACRSAITQAQRDLGCCLTTFFQVVSEIPDASVLFSQCGLEIGDTCVGRFSREPIGPSSFGGDDECRALREALPLQCQDDVSLGTLYGRAFGDPDSFVTDFCKGDCGELVYYYYLWSDKISGSKNAAEVDFLCAQNDDGATCAGILSDSSVYAAIFSKSTACENVSDKFCSDECSSIMQQNSHNWGCCHFTFGAVSDNITYVEGIIEQCEIPGNPHLCIGAFSGKPAAADPGDDIRGIATTVVSSAMTVIAIFTLTLIIQYIILC